MKALKKQGGYTLIITLVLIVLILLFTATFTVASMNQAKQVERTDESYVATSLAEMGSEFYIPYINKRMKENYSDYAKCLIDKSENHCLSTYQSKVIQDVQSFTSTNKAVDIQQVDNNSRFTLTSISPNAKDIVVQVTGEHKANKKSLAITFSIDKPDLTSFAPVETKSNTLLTPEVKNCIDNNDCSRFDAYDLLINRNHFKPKNHTIFKNDYYFLLDSATIGQAFTGGEFLGRSIYANTTSSNKLNFSKHFILNNTVIEARFIDLSHNAISQSYISDSVILTNEIKSTSGNKFRIVGDSTVCLDSKNIDDANGLNLADSTEGSLTSKTVKVFLKSSDDSNKDSKRFSGSNSAMLYEVSEKKFLEVCQVKAPAIRPIPTINDSYLTNISYN